MPSKIEPFRQIPSLVALSLATGLAMAVWAVIQNDPMATAEIRFLALVTTSVLLATLPFCDSLGGSGLARQGSYRPSLLTYTALPVLLLAAVAFVPTGPHRGVAVMGLLALWVVGAVTTRATSEPWSFENDLVSFVLLALATQWLIRPDQWLTLLDRSPLYDPLVLGSSFRLFAVPVLTGIACAVIAKYRSGTQALLALLAGALCLGRLSLIASLVLLCFAATLARNDFGALRRQTARATRTLAITALGLSFLALLVLEPVLAVFAFLSCAALSLPPGTNAGRFWPALFLVAAGVLGQIAPRVPGNLSSALFATLLLVPFLLICICLHPSRRWFWTLLIVLGLSLVALNHLPPSRALLIPALLAALGPIPQTAGPDNRLVRSNASYGLQRSGLAGLALLFVFVLASAGYPWLRSSPLLEAPKLLSAVVNSLDPEADAPNTLVDWPPRTLSAQSHTLELPCPKGWVRGLILDTAVANGESLAEQAELATVSLVRGGLEQEATLPTIARTLVFRRDTDEWSARRQDNPRALEPWLTWVDASPGLFGHRYRTRLDFEGPTPEVQTPEEPPCTLEFRLAAGLPVETQLIIFHAIALNARGGSSGSQ